VKRSKDLNGDGRPDVEETVGGDSVFKGE